MFLQCSACSPHALDPAGSSLPGMDLFVFLCFLASIHHFTGPACSALEEHPIGMCQPETPCSLLLFLGYREHSRWEGSVMHRMRGFPKQPQAGQVAMGSSSGAVGLFMPINCVWTCTCVPWGGDGSTFPVLVPKRFLIKSQ